MSRTRLSACSVAAIIACSSCRPAQPSHPIAAAPRDVCQEIASRLATLPAPGGIIDVSAYAGPLRCSVDPLAGTSKAGVLRLPPGVIELSQPLTVPTGWSIEGVYGGRPIPGTTADRGTRLSWVGDASDGVLRVVNAHHVALRGLTLSNDGSPGTTGLLLDSTNSPATHNVMIDGLNVYGFLVGVQWGSARIACPGTCTDKVAGAYEVDKIHLSNFNISSSVKNSEGIVVASGNAAQDSFVTEGYIHVDTTAIDVRLSGYVSFKRLSGGVESAEGAIFKLVIGNSVIIEQCESEMPSGHGTFIDVPPGCCGSSNGTLILIGNSFQNSVTIRQPVQVVSIGNWGAGEATISTRETHVTSLGDTFGPGGTGQWRVTDRAEPDAVRTIPTHLGAGDHPATSTAPPAGPPEALWTAAAAACLASGSRDRHLRWTEGTASTCSQACTTTSPKAKCVEGWSVWADRTLFQYGAECHVRDPSNGAGISGKLCCCTSTGDRQPLYP